MSFKGFTSSKRTAKEQNYQTLQPIGSDKFATDMLPKAVFPVSVIASNPEVNSTTTVIVSTGHSAKSGDSIRFTSGANSGVEASVVEVTATEITLGLELDTVPLLTDDFLVMRHITLTLDQSGALSTSSGPVQYVLDGGNQQVIEDTVTPANNRALPTKTMVNIDGVMTEIFLDTATVGNSVTMPTELLFQKDGALVRVNKDSVTKANTQAIPVEIVASDGQALNINLTTGDLNIATSHSGATPDSMQIGDGTNVLGITATNEAQTTDSTTQGNIGATNEAAAASDSATSGLNGLFKRYLARFTEYLGYFQQNGATAAGTDRHLPVMGWDGTDYRRLLTDNTGRLSFDTSGLATNATLVEVRDRLPATLGSKADAASMAVTQSTEDKAVQTAIRDRLPATLGSKADAASLAVTQSTEDKQTLADIKAALESNLDTVEDHYIRDFASSPLTTASGFVTLRALTAAIKKISFVNNSGNILLVKNSTTNKTIVIGAGAAFTTSLVGAIAEVIQISAITADATAGTIYVNFEG